MKTTTSRVLEAAMFVLLLVTSVFATGQVLVKANEAPCEGLACRQASDCGRKCFCNGPSTTCFLD